MPDKFEYLIGQKIGHLRVIRVATPEERKKIATSNSRYWLCECDCGNQCFKRTSSLTGSDGRGDYQSTSCGCLRTLRAFIASSKILSLEDEPWLYEFYKSDWKKFQLLHRAYITSGIKIINITKEKYKQFFNFFWNDKQFNAVYLFWQKHKNISTFYDLAKPSLDHIIPKSKGGTNTLDNFQFLTVFENLNKRDLTLEEWNEFKEKNHTKSDFYIETILGGD